MIVGKIVQNMMIGLNQVGEMKIMTINIKNGREEYYDLR